MIPHAMTKSTTWKAPKRFLTRNKNAVKEMRQFGYSESSNVLQCSISCADTWCETERQVGSACTQMDHAERKKAMEWSWTSPPK